MAVLRFKEHFRVEAVDDQIFLFAENGHHLLRGEIYTYLAPLLKEGIYSEDELVEKLEAHVTLAEVYYGLDRLKKGGYLECQEPLRSRAFSAFCQLLDVSVATALAQLQKKKIALHFLCEVDPAPFVALLQGMEINCVLEDADLDVFIVQDYLQKELKPQSTKPFLLFKPLGSEIWVGPLLEKEKTACYECLAARLRTNRMEEAYVQHKKGLTETIAVSIGATVSSLQAAFALAANEIFKWIVKEEKSSLKEKVVSLNLVTLSSQDHSVQKLSSCPCCGRASEGQKKPLLLKSQKKDENKDGGYHTRSPEYTLAKYAHLVSPITGIVKEFKLAHDSQEAESAIQVYHAGLNFAISNDLNGIYKASYRSCSAGKGKQSIQAKASALCEAIERYSGIFHEGLPHLSSTYRDIQAQAIHPNKVALISARQFAQREKSNPLAFSSHFIPEPFSDDAKIDWTPLWSLTQEKEKYLPSAYCYYGYPYERGGNFFHGDSNGCAAGNTLEEAILQGFFELVERDAVALWWYNRVQRPQVDLSSFKDPFFERIREQYATKLNRKIWVLDLTSDLKIPTFAALSCDFSGKDILMGFGTHFNPKIALERSLTEMNQLLDYFKTLKESTYLDTDAQIVKRWYDTATVETEPYLTSSEFKTAADYSFVEREDLLEDILECRRRVESKGMEMLVLDQTHPDIGLKVVRVVVPGLCHFWPRLAPGRLYDVPVELGWRSKPLLEEEMNPQPMFL